MEPFTYDIEVVGSCNLRCPSCPVGNSPHSERRRGLMNLQLFERIVDKIVRETPVIGSIGLFNWAEPFLHPELASFIEIVKKRGIYCRLSSNFNVVRNLDDVLRAKPDALRVSLSGYYPQTYSQTHRRGNVNVVKSNLYKLRALMDDLNSTTCIEVLYHLYAHNLEEDYVRAKGLCEELGFTFHPVWAYLMPVEKYLQYYEQTLGEEDLRLVDLLAVRPEEARDISIRLRREDCYLRANQLAINVDGSVALCCGSYDDEYTIAPDFLTKTYAELQASKYANPLCARCVSHGIHVTLVYGGVEQWNLVATRRLQAQGKRLSFTSKNPPYVEVHFPSEAAVDGFYQDPTGTIPNEKQPEFVDKLASERPRPRLSLPALLRRASNRAPGKRILVIDPFMPIYDQASGSRRLFEMLRILAAAGHAITFIARNGQNQERYAVELQQLGIEVYATDADKMRQLGFTVDADPINLPRLLLETQYDVAILSFYEIAEQYLEDIRRISPGTRIFVDTVDVHFVREERQAKLYRDRALLLKAAETKRRELAIYRRADALIAVTEEDRKHLLAEMPNAVVLVVPNIHEIATEVPPWGDREGILFVGNFRHTPNADAVLYFCREVLPRVRAEIPDVSLTIVGNAPPPKVQALAGNGVVVTGYVPDTGPYLRSRRVSVAPLRFGAGLKGKIGEALAAGLPVVTTSVGAEGMSLPIDQELLSIADDPNAFAAAIAHVYKDEVLWRTCSERGRAFVETNYSPGVVANQVIKILSAAGRGREQQNVNAVALGRGETLEVDQPAHRFSLDTETRSVPEDRVATHWEDASNRMSGLTSIIVLTHNQWKHTEQCLKSIEQLTPEPHELILVDNASVDGTPDRLHAYASAHENVRIISNSTNRGFAAGNNQGLALARGEYVLLLNNDTIVTEGWLPRMLAVFERYPKVGVVGPMSNYVSGPQLVPNASYKNIDEMEAFAARWAVEHAGESVPCTRMVGFCLLARRAVVDQIGGLDEQFGSGNFEDDDFCIRAALAGYEARIAQDVFVHHTGGQTFKGAGIDYHQSMMHNWKLFKSKWGIPADTSLEEGYLIPVRSWTASHDYVPLPEVGLDDQANTVTSRQILTR